MLPHSGKTVFKSIPLSVTHAVSALQKSTIYVGFYLLAIPLNFLPIHDLSLKELQVFHYLCSHNVGSYEGRHLPAWDGTTNNHPDQAEDPEGHTYNLNALRCHPGKSQDGEKDQRHKADI